MSKEREKQILEHLLKKKKVTVKELAGILYTSESSIRRDLASLEKSNLIKRVFGGAVIEETALSDTKIPFILREYEGASAKVDIAKKAAALVEDGNVLFLDASTSAYNLIPFLAGKSNITVITSGVKTLEKLAEYGIPAVSTGGKLIGSCLSLVGVEACNFVSNINADVAFFSCRGVSDKGYLTDISPEEDHVRRRMIANAKKSYLLCTSDKFGKEYFHNLCRTDDITAIISEKE